MKAAKIVVMAAAILTLAGLTAHAQVFFEVKVKGTIYMDDGTKVDRVKFSDSDVLDALGVPGGGMFYFWDGDAFDEEVFATDANGDFAGFLMYVSGNVSCAFGSKESSTKSSTTATCVEMISLFDSEEIDGTAKCDYTDTFDSKKEQTSLKKKCHIQGIVPDSAPSVDIIGWPIEIDVSGGKASDFPNIIL
jgi:hypothetical protein